MNGKKKLNLLPEEIKNKYANKYITIGASIIGGFFILLLMIQYIHIGILSWQTNRILDNNEKYDMEKQEIAALEENIKNYNAFLADYENDCFPFSLFMYDIESLRPNDVYIISIDSSERLIDEGKKAKTEEESATNSNKETEETEDETENSDSKDAQDSKDQEKQTKPKIAYTEDLSGREIVIRGFGSSQESISNFIYDITHLSYIGSAKITAIEEHKIENGIYNVFEITVTGGVYN